MDFSSIKGNQVFDVAATLTEFIAALFDDDDMVELFSEYSDADGVKKTGKLMKIVSAIVSRHRDEVVGILSAVNGTTPEKYMEGLDAKKLMSDVREMMTADGVGDFLASPVLSPM